MRHRFQFTDYLLGTAACQEVDTARIQILGTPDPNRVVRPIWSGLGPGRLVLRVYEEIVQILRLFLSLIPSDINE